MDASLPTQDQFLLFPRDPASDLARALLDTAWLVIQSRPYLTASGEADLRSCLAYFRERLVAVTKVERLVREIPARYHVAARPAPPPTLRRVVNY